MIRSLTRYDPHTNIIQCLLRILHALQVLKTESVRLSTKWYSAFINPQQEHLKYIPVLYGSLPFGRIQIFIRNTQIMAGISEMEKQHLANHLQVVNDQPIRSYANT